MPKLSVSYRSDRECYQAQWRDSTGRRRFQRLEATDPISAGREAAALESQLAAQDVRGWQDMLDSAHQEWLSQRSKAFQDSVRNALTRFYALVRRPETCQVAKEDLVKFRNALQASGKSPATVGSYLRHIGCVLRWAERNGWITEVPTVTLERGSQEMRGFPIRPEQFEALLQAAPHEGWRRLLNCMYLGGLRVGEAVHLRWDAPPVQVDLDGGAYPALMFEAWGQKSRRNERCPITPEFATWLRSLPGPREGLLAGLDVTADHASDEVSRMARRAGFEATAHDLRRAFGTRMAIKVKPPILQRLMRHRDIRTTMKYYVNLDADDICRELYEQT